MKIETGNLIEIKKKNKEIIKGIYVSEEKNFYYIKLKDGYNIGINKRNIDKLTILKKIEKEKRITKNKINSKKRLPKITILHTGGTIASKVDYETGGVIAQFKPEELIATIPEIEKIANIDSKLIGNIMSENMNFNHYNLLAKEIKKEIKNKPKGIIITHGTDTMHYTSAALSFILKGIETPIILVGAQRSSDRGSSDAKINLLSSIIFITKTNIKGINICMHENQSDDTCIVLNGLKNRKMHTSRRDAFRPINDQIIAKINYKERSVKIIKEEKKKEGGNKRKKERLFDEKIKVGLIKTRPGMRAEEFKIYKGYDGLIIEGTGLGHVPISKVDKYTKENEKIFKIIKELNKKTVIAMAPQTIYGRIQMNVYSEGRKLKAIGVIGNNLDMTPETAYIKLAWLLSNYNKKEVKEKYCENLAGEINKRTENLFLK